MLQRVILQAAREVSGKRYWRIEFFNDDPRTTHADVLEVLRHARENIIAGMIGDLQPWHRRCLRAMRAFLGPAPDHGTTAYSPEHELEPHMGQTRAPCRDPETASRPPRPEGTARGCAGTARLGGFSKRGSPNAGLLVSDAGDVARSIPIRWH